jgi:hypothetical protein
MSIHSIPQIMVSPVTCRFITLAITWPQGVLGEEDSLAVAAQVNGDVS